MTSKIRDFRESGSVRTTRAVLQAAQFQLGSQLCSCGCALATVQPLMHTPVNTASHPSTSIHTGVHCTKLCALSMHTGWQSQILTGALPTNGGPCGETISTYIFESQCRFKPSPPSGYNSARNYAFRCLSLTVSHMWSRISAETPLFCGRER